MCAVVFCVLATGQPAAAQQHPDLSACLNDRTELERRLAACTRVIKSRQVARSRAFAHASRGGLLAIHKRDFPAAIADLDQALRLEPGLPAFIQIRASVNMQAGQFAAAIADYDQLLRRDPRMAGVQRARGVAYLRNGDYDQAIAALDEALKVDREPRDQAETLASRADAHVRNGDPARGLQDYARSIELDPKVDQRYAERAALHLDRGEHDQAMRDLDRVIAEIPADAASRGRRGTILRLRGDNERALRDLDEAIRLDPKLGKAFMERAMVRAAMGRIDPAIADARESLRLHEPTRRTPVSDYEAANALGTALGEQQRHGDCIVLMTRAIEALARPDKEHWQTFNVRGICAYQEKRLDAAEADYRKALALDPDQAEAINNLAYVLMERGRNLEEALALSVRANALAPDNAGYTDTLGAIYLRLGRLAPAVEMLEKADKLTDPGFPVIKMNLGDAYWRTGRRGDAVARWSQALALKPDAALRGDLEARLRNGLPEPAAPYAVAAAPAAAPSAAADPGRRVALVIGNSAYKAVAALPNPARDAAAMAAALRGIGFATVRLEGDLSREKLTAALRGFAREAASADWAVVYFAGHGLEVNGTNYLVPVDARLETDRDVPFETLPLEQVLNAVEGARKLRLVILDACRDNPFVRGMRRTAATRAIGRGLARVEPEGGTLVAYAARNGEVALDGEGANSPFVGALLKHLPTPGLEIGKLFRQVRDDVMAATGRKQEPYVYGSLPGEDFFFVARK